MSGIECRLNFENQPVRSRDIMGGGRKQPPPPLPLIGVARSLPLIGLNEPRKRPVTRVTLLDLDHGLRSQADDLRGQVNLN